MTRIAAGHPGIWPDICAENRDAIVAALDRLVAALADHARPGRPRATAPALLDRAGAARRAARVNLPAARGRGRGPRRDARAGARPARRPGRGHHAGGRARASTSTTWRSPTRPRASGACSSWSSRRRAADAARGSAAPRPRLPPVDLGRLGVSVLHGRGRPAAARPDPRPRRQVDLAPRAVARRPGRGHVDASGASRTATTSPAPGPRSRPWAPASTGRTDHRRRSRLREPDDVLDVGNSGTASACWPGCAPALPWLTVLDRRRLDRGAPHGPGHRAAAADGRTRSTGATAALAPLVVRGGGPHGIEYATPVASAQVKSAILLAGLGADGRDRRPRDGADPRPHRGAAGAGRRRHRSRGRRAHRPPPAARRSRPSSSTCPGDPSQAAFWAVAGLHRSRQRVVVDDVYLGPPGPASSTCCGAWAPTSRWSPRAAPSGPARPSSTAPRWTATRSRASTRSRCWPWPPPSPRGRRSSRRRRAASQGERPDRHHHGRAVRPGRRVEAPTTAWSYTGPPYCAAPPWTATATTESPWRWRWRPRGRRHDDDRRVGRGGHELSRFRRGAARGE